MENDLLQELRGDIVSAANRRQAAEKRERKIFEFVLIAFRLGRARPVSSSLLGDAKHLVRKQWRCVVFRLERFDN